MILNLPPPSPLAPMISREAGREGERRTRILAFKSESNEIFRSKNARIGIVLLAVSRQPENSDSASDWIFLDGSRTGGGRM